MKDQDSPKGSDKRRLLRQYRMLFFNWLCMWG